ncbi:hypothetical protein CDAR_457621 [Caerostris darwini]|uniref:Uncharacterized protein n=1 Tax=Caerostris darwini TaxID=1538125 RepID=A0AAV4QPF1_9ARAC|nr:hypothetical protein CDAR_457621 [Caerostris darwini]
MLSRKKRKIPIVSMYQTKNLQIFVFEVEEKKNAMAPSTKQLLERERANPLAPRRRRLPRREWKWHMLAIKLDLKSLEYSFIHSLQCERFDVFSVDRRTRYEYGITELRVLWQSELLTLMS